VKKYNNICGIHFTNPFNKKHKKAEKAYQAQKEQAEARVAASKRKDLDDVILESELKRAEQAKRPASPVQYADEKDREISENIDQIGHVVGNLKVMAQDMNAEMDAQEAKLDAIDLVGKHVDTTLQEAHGKIRKFAY
jgi:hypothetical protein